MRGQTAVAILLQPMYYYYETYVRFILLFDWKGLGRCRTNSCAHEYVLTHAPVRTYVVGHLHVLCRSNFKPTTTATVGWTLNRQRRRQRRPCVLLNHSARECSFVNAIGTFHGRTRTNRIRLVGIYVYRGRCYTRCTRREFPLASELIATVRRRVF